MSSKVFAEATKVVSALSVLALCLLQESFARWPDGSVDSEFHQISAVFQDAGTQWMVFLCAGIYLCAFRLLRFSSNNASCGRTAAEENRRLRIAVLRSSLRARLNFAVRGGLRHLQAPTMWLAGLVAVAALAYAACYPHAVKSTQALTLLGAAMLGQGAGLWAARSLKSKVQSLKSGGRPKSGVQSPKSKTVVGVLIVLLTAAAVWQAETGHLFQYRGLARWSGPWDNPNTFGMLMGVGLVLALGSLKSKDQSLKSKVQSRPNAEKTRIPRIGTEGGPAPRSTLYAPRCGRWLKRAFLVVAAGVMSFGLLKSYSRGAWVGAVVGLGVLISQSSRFKVQGSRLKGRLALGVVVVSLGVLAFWGFRQAERGMVRRAYSAANANDFSWRNRVAAYEGALQMLAEKPWFGFGWNQPEQVYDRYYRAARVDEAAAIQMNDYFTLGTTLGLPALVCFVVYVGLSLSPRSKVQSPKSEAQSRESAGPQSEDGRQGTDVRAPLTLDLRLWTLDCAAVCRAGVTVLLVGFWFDGGLFKLATGATFWILLELGKADTDCTDCTDE